MQRYLKFWLVLTGSLLLLTGACNFLVDPYGLFRLVDRPGFNQIKPKSGAHGEMVKAYQVLRVQPQALILGNSRAEVGFDPLHPAWPKQPVYNLALPGTGTYTSLQYLQHVLAGSQNGNKPKLVVWGLDFMDFLVDRNAPQRKFNPASQRLQDNQNHAAARVSQQIRDNAQALLTLSGLQDSIQTLSSQYSPYSSDLTRQGFNPMHDYLKITADEGYWAVFRQKDLANFRAFLHQPRDIFDAEGHASPALNDLREVIRLCRNNNIDLRLVIYPYHAHLLEIIRLTGHQPAFEVWKRALVAVSEDASQGGKPIPLWDFSQINEISNESIPAKNDRKTRMRWYWEAGHFKRELGDLVLNRVFELPDNPQNFGVQLTSGNVETQINSDRIQERAYRLGHPEDVDTLRAMAINTHPATATH